MIGGGLLLSFLLDVPMPELNDEMSSAAVLLLQLKASWFSVENMIRVSVMMVVRSCRLSGSLVMETPYASLSLCSVKHLLLLFVRAVAGSEGSALIVDVQLRVVEVPEDERARVHVVAGTVDRAPPAADLAKESVIMFCWSSS